VELLKTVPVDISHFPNSTMIIYQNKNRMKMVDKSKWDKLKIFSYIRIFTMTKS